MRKHFAFTNLRFCVPGRCASVHPRAWRRPSHGCTADQAKASSRTRRDPPQMRYVDRARLKLEAERKAQQVSAHSKARDGPGARILPAAAAHVRVDMSDMFVSARRGSELHLLCTSCQGNVETAAARSRIPGLSCWFAAHRPYNGTHCPPERRFGPAGRRLLRCDAPEPSQRGPKERDLAAKDRRQGMEVMVDVDKVVALVLPSPTLFCHE